MDKFEAYLAKFRALPRYIQDGSLAVFCILLGRLGAPWLF